jgi:hypothetical protein
MTRDEARDHLLAGKGLTDKAWSWFKESRHCWSEEDCCYDWFGEAFFEDGRPVVERVLDDIESYVGFESLSIID